MANLDPYLLRAFVSVADGGTINGAAVALHRTQAAVSMQIKRLEELLGGSLFDRTAKGLTLNEQGVLLLPYAREILALNDAAQQRLGAPRLQGRIKLGVIEDFAATHLVAMLREFRDRHPAVDLDLIIEGNRALAAQFDDNRLDLMICDAALVSRKPAMVWREQLLWTVRADLAVQPDAEQPVVMFSESCPWRTNAMAALADRNLRWRIVCETSTLVAMSTAVRVGIGIGPMFAATVPAGCRTLDNAADMPAPVPIDFGLFVRATASEQARHLAEFVYRQRVLQV